MLYIDVGFQLTLEQLRASPLLYLNRITPMI